MQSVALTFLYIIILLQHVTMADTDSNGSDLPQHGQLDVAVNKLLCFIQQKYYLLPVDDLVKITYDFYTFDEVEAARSTLAN